MKTVLRNCSLFFLYSLDSYSVPVHHQCFVSSVLIYVWDRETWCQKWRHAFVHAVLQKILKINQRYSSVAILMKPIIAKNYNINVKFLSIRCYLTTVALIGLEYFFYPMSRSNQFPHCSSLCHWLGA